jgi:Tol biopolymer transport system component/imidazolonepropionase-like amidohydrolase
MAPGAAAQNIVPDTTARAGPGALPLEPTRTFEMIASEGSWISVDVHPGGEKLVFGLLGDLYTLPVDGGEATRITRGMAFDSQPRYGPDGERIVFVSDRSGSEQVWVLNRSEEDTTQVSTGDNLRFHSPEWTPNGDYVIASRQTSLGDAATPWLYHVEGGTGTSLVDGPDDLRLSGAAFGADPEHVWFAQRSGAWEYNATLPEYQLAVYNRDTGDLYERSSRFGSAFRPTLSPDGQWLVYGTRHDAQTGLRIRNRETGEERWLAYPVQRDDQESIATRDVYPGMSFTPDSETLIASYGGKIWRLPVDGGAPTKIPFTADVEVPMGPKLDFEYPIEDTPQFTARQVRSAVPSPSGDRLAFTVLDRLYVMDYPNGTPRRLTDQDLIQAHPTWSPDGESIAYAAWSNDEGGHLYRVPSSGGPPTQITEAPATYQQPAWSPDGNRIVALRGPARAFRTSTSPTAPGATDDIVWVPADGGTATQVTPAEGRHHPHFTTNPDRIYVYGQQQGLQSMRYDGTDVKTHLKGEGLRQPLSDEPLPASLALMGPSGDQAVAQVHNSLYRIAVPMVGGEAPTVTVTNPDAASVPVRKLSTIGGQFPAWGAEGQRVHFSAGNAHFRYDLAAARAAEDSAEAAPDSLREDDDGPVYKPEETRIQVDAPRDVPRGTVALRGARVITMEGDEVIENADLVVENNRIAAVGKRGTGEIPDGAETIDVSGHTIIPGLVDTHAHLRPSWGLHKTQVWQYLINLAHGVTTTRDPQTSTTDVLTYADKVRSGRMLGPRIYSTGPGVFQSEQIESLGDARNVLRRYSDYYDTKTVKQYVAGDREQRQWIIEAARDLELMPTTEGALDLKMDLTQIIDGYPGHEHTFPVYPLYEDIVGLTAESQAAYTPTLLVNYGGPWAENYFYTRENPHDNAKLQRFMPHSEIDRRTRRKGMGAGPGPGGWFMEEEHVFDEQAETLAAIADQGGRAGVGSHGQLQGLGYHWELWAMATGGLSNHETLRLATLTGADAIGLDQDVGSITPGKLADLVVLRKNPLDNLRHTQTIRYVMKNGRLYEGDTLDEVYPRSRELPTMWWQRTGPNADVPGIGRTQDGISLDESLQN